MTPCVIILRGAWTVPEKGGCDAHMNLVDYVVIGLIGLSVLFGFYRGFVSSVLNMGGCLISFGLSFWLYPKVAVLIQNNEELIRTLMHYTDASSRIGDLELAISNVAQLSQEKIMEVLSKVQLPPPLNTLLEVNLENQVWMQTGLNTVSDYVSQPILTASINIICFLLCFIALYLVVSIVLKLIRAVFRFPLLKQLDWLAGGAFGLARGLIFGYALFALVPLVLTMVPFDQLSQLIEESQLAAFFNNGNLILSIMNQRL